MFFEIIQRLWNVSQVNGESVPNRLRHMTKSSTGEAGSSNVNMKTVRWAWPEWSRCSLIHTTNKWWNTGMWRLTNERSWMCCWTSCSFLEYWNTDHFDPYFCCYFCGFNISAFNSSSFSEIVVKFSLCYSFRLGLLLWLQFIESCSKSVIYHHHHHHRFNVHFIPRLIKGMDGCFHGNVGASFWWRMPFLTPTN